MMGGHAGKGHDDGAERNSGYGFAIGLLSVAMIGAGLGLLFAPRSGTELRGQIADSATSAGKAVTDTYRQAGDVVKKTVADVTMRGQQAYDRARELWSHDVADVDRAARG